LVSNYLVLVHFYDSKFLPIPGIFGVVTFIFPKGSLWKQTSL